jgi:hypothetical protein
MALCVGSLKTQTDQALDFPRFGSVTVFCSLADQLGKFRLQVRLQTAAFLCGHG